MALDADPASAAADPSVRGWNAGRDAIAVALLAGATLLPWNLSFGIAIPGSSTLWFAVLVAVTVLSVGSVVATYAGRPELRARLSIPYALFVVAIVAVDVVQTVRYGGTPTVPPGVGPGAWLGAAGAVLAGQPVLTGTPQSDVDRRRPWLERARIIGIASMVLGALSVGFNLFWQTSQAIPDMGHAAYFGRSIATIGTAVVYDAAALAPVILGSGWILQRNKASRLAVITLGISTLAAGLLVWLTHLGRDVDAFHGVAQITSWTAAVGFEGYLAWAVAAAIFAPLTLRAVLTQRPIDGPTWRSASRKALLMVAVGCAGSAVMRLADLIDTVSFGIDRPVINGVGLIAINIATAALAWWLRIDHTARPRVLSALPWAYTILLLLSLSRVPMAITLAPRQTRAAAAAAQAQPVYGNALTQQLTSTFDIVLCLLAVAIGTAALIIARATPPTPGRHIFAQAAASSQSLDPDTQLLNDQALRPANPMSAASPNRHTSAAASSAAHQVAAPSPTDQTSTQTPDSTSPPGKHGVDAVLQASTQRFGAGTTYTGRGTTTPNDDS